MNKANSGCCCAGGCAVTVQGLEMIPIKSFMMASICRFMIFLEMASALKRRSFTKHLPLPSSSMMIKDLSLAFYEQK